MHPTARCLAAKAPGFFKRSTEELSRLTRIGEHCPHQLVLLVPELRRRCSMEYGDFIHTNETVLSPRF